MSKQFYVLNIQLGEYEPGRIIADDGSSWIMAADDYLDHRGSIKEGELAILLDYARHTKLTSILEPFGDDAEDFPSELQTSKQASQEGPSLAEGEE